MIENGLVKLDNDTNVRLLNKLPSETDFKNNNAENNWLQGKDVQLHSSTQLREYCRHRGGKIVRAEVCCAVRSCLLAMLGKLHP